MFHNYSRKTYIYMNIVPKKTENGTKRSTQTWTISYIDWRRRGILSIHKVGKIGVDECNGDLV